jgi:acetolactate synthase-1/2/3 large subunit
MKVYDALAKALRNHPVDTVFGLIGDANLYMVDAFVRNYGGSYVAVTHENAAVLGAMGFAMVDGGFGVATVTHGPGLTNTVTALVEASKSQTPLVVICGDTPIEDRQHLQDISQREVVLPTGAGFEQVRTPRTSVEDLAIAIRRAVFERRPIVLNVPSEIQWLDVDYHQVNLLGTNPQAVMPDPSAIDRAIGIVSTVRRPIVLAGRGATGIEARSALLRFAKRIGAPLATTLRATSLFRDDPFDLGVFGTLSNSAGLEAILQSDCILAFGASLNRFTTATGSLLYKKRVIHCDIDPAAIGRFAPVDASVVGDVASVANTLIQWLDEAQIAVSDFRSDALAQSLLKLSTAEEPDDVSTNATVDLHTALHHLDRVIPPERTLVTDAGRFLREAFMSLHSHRPRGLIYSVASGSIGLGMGTAIGAACGSPQQPVVMVCGDGGLMLGGLSEFNTAVRHKLDLIVIVCNDGAYGAEHIQFRRKDMDPKLSLNDWPDFAPVANALGGTGITVRNREDLYAISGTIENRDRPVLIDLKLDPDHVMNF